MLLAIALLALPGRAQLGGARAALLAECWQRQDWVGAMLENDACHLAWERAVATLPVVGAAGLESLVNAATGQPTRGNGAVRLALAGGYAAMFKPCDAPFPQHAESWKAEVLVHAVDRVFRLNRVPAVSVRRVDAAQVRALLLEGVGPDGSAEVSRRFDDVARICQGGRRDWWIGSVMGWTRDPIEVIFNYSASVVEAAGGTLRINPARPEPAHVEYARLVLGLFLTGMPLKLDHNVGVLPNTVPPTVVSFDNDRASWGLRRRVSLRPGEPPVCTGDTRGSGGFAPGVVECKLGMGRRRVGVRHLLSFLRTACVFPRDAAFAIKRHGALGVSKAVAAFVTERSMAFVPVVADADSALTLARYNATRLDRYVRLAADAVTRCIHWGRAPRGQDPRGQAPGFP